MVRLRRWYQAHRPEAQRRRREAYAKEVKAKYPRVKITTVIRKKEDRPEAADHGRSKTRNQRYIDSLRSTAAPPTGPSDS